MNRAIAACLGVVLLAGCAGAGAGASAVGPTSFRIYRVNDDMQLDLIPALNEDEPGCHNLLLRFTVYRVAQIGFQHCTVYAEKDCKAGSEVQVAWKQKEAPVTQFTQGDRWFLVSDDRHGHKMGSWFCKARE